jgi:hypothetical protein
MVRIRLMGLRSGGVLTNFRMDREKKAELLRYAHRHGLKLQWIYEQAVNEWLARNDK